MPDERNESGRRVAWVTGASRGVGRGVAIALGQAGWVVYVTARSSAAGRTGHLPGTVEETADWVRTEGVLQFAAQLDLTGSQSPEGVGRAIAALADDPERLTLTGRALAVEALAARYGVDVRA
jgi:NAD(P)-dependent dehydrogenase (short-subunit alcohol dehydrogenase family)